MPDSPSKIRLLITGFVMGSADVVPGVSGGTIALVMGIYEQLLEAIASVDRRLLGQLTKWQWGALRTVPWGFVLPLGLGIATAVLTLAGPLEHWMQDEQSRINLLALFCGLVLASAIAVGGRLSWHRLTWIAAVSGALVASIIVRLTPSQGSDSLLAFFLAGAVAISAMILPGISGSFILFIMGQYERALAAVSDFNLIDLLVLAAGVTVGLATFVRILRRLLGRWHDTTLAAMAGFMVGSLWKVWPWRECLEGDAALCAKEALSVPTWGGSLAVAAGLAVVGFLVVTVFDHWESGRNPVVKVWRAAVGGRPGSRGGSDSERVGASSSLWERFRSRILRVRRQGNPYSSTPFGVYHETKGGDLAYPAHVTWLSARRPWRSYRR